MASEKDPIDKLMQPVRDAEHRDTVDQRATEQAMAKRALRTSMIAHEVESNPDVKSAVADLEATLTPEIRTAMGMIDMSWNRSELAGYELSLSDGKKVTFRDAYNPDADWGNGAWELFADFTASDVSEAASVAVRDIAMRNVGPVTSWSISDGRVLLGYRLRRAYLKRIKEATAHNKKWESFWQEVGESVTWPIAVASHGEEVTV